MLYQDYPFALADLFLKRALALLLLVAISFVAIALFGASSLAFARFVQMDPRQIGALVTVWVATALLYPTLRRARPGSSTWWCCTGRLSVAARHDRPEGFKRASRLRRCCPSYAKLLAPALNARSVVWHESSAHEEEELGSAVVLVEAQAIGRG